MKVKEALKCVVCDFLSKNEDTLNRHFRTEHRNQVGEEDRHRNIKRWEMVKVQQWVLSGKGSKYWIVAGGMEMLRMSTNLDIQNNEGVSWEVRMEQMETERLSSHNDGVITVTDRNNIDDTTPWLLHTKWPQIFAAKDLRLIGRSRYSDLDDKTRKVFPTLISPGFTRKYRRLVEEFAADRPVSH